MCAYSNYFMDLSSIKAILMRANLALPPKIIQQTAEFLEKYIGITPANANYEVFASLAIMGQVKELSPVDSGAMVSYGIPLQQVLRHLGGLSKEILLEEITRQYSKWREAPVWLCEKTDRVKLAYRIYKKYRAVFEELINQHCCMETQSTYNFMAIFWIVYLLLKNDSQGASDAIQWTTILYSLFKFIFGEFITQLSEEEIASKFRKQFVECQVPSQRAYKIYRERMLKHLVANHQDRYGDDVELSLQTLATDDHYMIRYLDDFAKNYDKFKQDLPKHSVDEISFLQFDRTLTPQTVKKQPSISKASICKKMNFDSDQEDNFDDKEPNQLIEAESPVVQAQQTSNLNVRPRTFSFTQIPEPMSPFRPLQKHHYNISPLTARHQNLAWVNKITSRAYQKDVEQVKSIFEKYVKEQFSTYSQRAMNNILQSITEFTPACMDFQKRKSSIFSFFSYFILKVSESHPNDEERKSIFSSKLSYDSILCLSTNLFNFAYQSLQSSYRQYCQIFEIKIIDAIIPFNWFGLNAEMPKNIEGYLYDLQKKILIQQIWQDGQGYNLLLNSKNYKSQAILKRLRRHADQRTQQLCQSMRIEDRRITKVVNLVRFILDNRQSLLKDHKIDQIIVCSIASILSINNSKNFSLSEIFNHYNRLLYSLNISRTIFFNRQGKQINLIEYYNNVFLEQVEEIISNEQQAQKILETPVRLERKQSFERGVNLTPMNIKFKQPLPIGILGCKKVKENEEKRGGSYRNYLVTQLKNMNINEQDEEENENKIENQEPPSPSFGGGGSQSQLAPPKGFFKTMSFGSPGQKY